MPTTRKLTPDELCVLAELTRSIGKFRRGPTPRGAVAAVLAHRDEISLRDAASMLSVSHSASAVHWRKMFPREKPARRAIRRDSARHNPDTRTLKQIALAYARSKPGSDAERELHDNLVARAAAEAQP